MTEAQDCFMTGTKFLYFCSVVAFQFACLCIMFVVVICSESKKCGSKLAEASSKENQLATENHEFRNAIASQNLANCDLKRQLFDANAKLSTLKNKLLSIDKEVVTLRQEINAEHSTVIELKSENAALQKSLTSKAKKWQKRLLKKSQDIDDHKRTILRKNEEIEEHKRRLDLVFTRKGDQTGDVVSIELVDDLYQLYKNKADLLKQSQSE